MFYVVIMKYFWFESKKFLIYDEMEHGIRNGLRIKVVGDIGRKGRKRREPVDEVDLALGSRALSAYMRQHMSIQQSNSQPGIFFWAFVIVSN